MRKTKREQIYDQYLADRKKNQKPTSMTASDVETLLKGIDLLLVMLDNAASKFNDFRQNDLWDVIDDIRKDTIENNRFQLLYQEVTGKKFSPDMTKLRYDGIVEAELSAVSNGA